MRLYTDIDAFCCEVLKARIADGGLPPGEVWCRDIKMLTADELRPFTQIHLFAGIGGSPLGFKWAGWPDEWSLVTGGFPCQQVSVAGKGEGIGDEESPTERSGLFWEALRIIRIKQPAWLLVENVGALSTRGLNRVERALGEAGYDLSAIRVGAWAVGSPQERERWWIVAHLRGSGCEPRRGSQEDQEDQEDQGIGWDQPAGGDQSGRELVNTNGCRCNRGSRQSVRRSVRRDAIAGSGEGGALADVCDPGLRTERVGGATRPEPDQPSPRGVAQGDAAGTGLEGHGTDAGRSPESESRYASPRRWPHPLWVDADGNPVATPQYEWESPRLHTRGMAGLADGISARLASALNKFGVAATGNAQVPQNVEVIARAMMAAAPETR